MEFSSYLVVFTLVILFAVLLPTLSGIGSFKIDKNARKATSKKPHSLQFKLKADGDSKGVSSNSRRPEYEIDSRTGLKRRIVGKCDEDPNSYDYDVDDLINEDKQQEEKNQGTHSKDYEEFV
ncbi:YDL121C [Zygosaccharomyces parabailii]|nr:YDL121C [Zygosaccharomyces parabailii]